MLAPNGAMMKTMITGTLLAVIDGSAWLAWTADKGRSLLGPGPKPEVRTTWKVLDQMREKD
jgi:hypothetical protein